MPKTFAPKRCEYHKNRASKYSFLCGSFMSHGDDITQVQSQFESWAQSVGICNHKVRPRYFEGSGWGLVASDDIAKGECIIAVPETLFLSAHKVLQDPEIGGTLCEVCHYADAPDVDDYPEVLHDEEVVVVYLMRQFFHSAQPLSPWLKMWPHSMNTTNLLSQEELQHLPSWAAKKVRTHKAYVLSKYQAVCRILLSKYPDQFPADIYTEDRFLWTYALFESRRFVSANPYRTLARRPVAAELDGEGAGEDDSDEEDGSGLSEWGGEASKDQDCAPTPPKPQEDGHDEQEVLVPFADMFNHSFLGETDYYYSTKREEFVAMATNNYQKGQQVGRGQGCVSNVVSPSSPSNPLHSWRHRRGFGAW